MTSLEPWMDCEQWKQLESQPSPFLGNCGAHTAKFRNKMASFPEYGFQVMHGTDKSQQLFLHVLPEQETSILCTNALSVDFCYFSIILFILM